jgi:excisionase family DNA binding protein
MEDRHLSLSEFAGLMGVSERTARRWIKSGKLRAYKPGRDYRIPETAVREFVEESEVSPKGLAPPSLQRSFNGLLEEERRARQAEQVAQAALALNTLWVKELKRGEFTEAEYHEVGKGLYALDTLLADAMTEEFTADEEGGSEAYRAAWHLGWQALYDLARTLQRAHGALEARGITNLSEYRSLRAADQTPTDSGRSRSAG